MLAGGVLKGHTSDNLNQRVEIVDYTSGQRQPLPPGRLMSLSRDCRLPIVLAAALLACGMCCGQEAPGDQKKQPKIYTIRPSDERDIRPVAPSTLPSRSQQPTDGQAPAPARSRGVPAAREK